MFMFCENQQSHMGTHSHMGRVCSWETPDRPWLGRLVHFPNLSRGVVGRSVHFNTDPWMYLEIPIGVNGDLQVVWRCPAR